MEYELCPVCDRELIPGFSVDKHHLIPRCKGGKDIEPELIHRVCHIKIHSLFTEKELYVLYNSWDDIKAHPDMQKFIKWVQKKSPEYYDTSRRASRRR